MYMILRKSGIAETKYSYYLTCVKIENIIKFIYRCSNAIIYIYMCFSF